MIIMSALYINNHYNDISNFHELMKILIFIHKFKVIIGYNRISIHMNEKLMSQKFPGANGIINT
jgi:hypothetical protein